MPEAALLLRPHGPWDVHPGSRLPASFERLALRPAGNQWMSPAGPRSGAQEEAMSSEAKREARKAYYLAHREEELANAKAWELANPERKRLSSKKWKETHKEYLKDYRKSHPEMFKEMRRKSYLAHATERKEYSRKYQLAHPERIQVIHAQNNTTVNPVIWNTELTLVPGHTNLIQRFVVPVRMSVYSLTFLLQVIGYSWPATGNLKISPIVNRKLV